MCGLGFFRLYFIFLWAMNGPSLMSWAPKVSFVLDFIGVRFSIFWLLLIPLFFPFAIPSLFASLFLTLALAFCFAFSRGRSLKTPR